ncbi:DUF4136 domain-containing protein [Sphingomonas piscis]|uniref:DUF4136 domain-containing protein n=1 Tax=Sphingomonas piscis TaxID=2714943 RepID=A0A6G7YLP3_9SPHN|nr:DUF4136 domain-containing protein [Sphingomonas piscis]QIK77665.1 DUF4136 domain-containing protein [Sphingomonas piscis]
MFTRKLAAAAFLGVAALGLSGCAMGLPTQVSRYQAMPAPAGQSFFVVPADGRPAGLEFSRYAGYVSQAMAAQGYAAASSPQTATMLVRVAYGVDQGTTEYRADPFYRNRGFYSPYYGGFYGSWGRPLYRSRYYGGYSPFYYGWDDPFYSPFDSGIDSYTVYKSRLDVNIVRRADNAPLFEGKAQARSSNDNLQTLVPNLVEAMFTGFPGRNGETVRITVPPRKRA